MAAHADAPAPTLRPIKSILVAAGLTPESVGGVLLAGSLAKTLGGTLHAVHVIEPISAEQQEAIPGLAIAHAEHAQEELGLFAQSHGLGPDGKSGTHLHVATGNAESEILAALRRLHADLLVIGRYGRGGLKHGQLGSIAGRLARSSPVSVLVAQPEFRGPIKRIGVACDFSPESALAVRRALDLAARLALPEVLLLHSYELPRGYHRIMTYEEACARLEEFATSKARAISDSVGASLVGIKPERLPKPSASSPAPSTPIRLRLKTTHGGAGSAIPELALSEAVDLLVVNTHGRSRAAMFMLERKTEKMLHTAGCSIWAEKSPEFYQGFVKAVEELMKI